MKETDMKTFMNVWLLGCVVAIFASPVPELAGVTLILSIAGFSSIKD
jgi:hypothetical protein